MPRYSCLLSFVLACVARPAQGQNCDNFELLHPLNGARVTMSSDGSRVLAGDFFWDEQNGAAPISVVTGNALAGGSGRLSGDGEVIVGVDANDGDSVLWWSPLSGSQVLGAMSGGMPTPYAVDEDGDVVVGPVGDPSLSAVGGVWSQGAVTTITSPGAVSVVPTAVSADGMVVVGYTRDASGVEFAFRWTAGLGLQSLGTISSFYDSSRAVGVSADGSVVVGNCEYFGGGPYFTDAFKWTAGGGMQTITANASTNATGVSGDGNVIVGFRAAGTPAQPFRASVPGGFQLLSLPGLSPSQAPALPRQVSYDGSTITGWSGSTGDVFLLRSTPLGAAYCGSANPNSTGCASQMEVHGSAVVSANDVTLSARRLPIDVFGFFLMSADRGNVLLGNSEGILCLDGFIGRFVGPGQILNSGTAGVFDLGIDLNSVPNVPVPSGLGVVQPGETWNFQAWHRDVDAMGNATSNLTDAVSVTFR